MIPIIKNKQYKTLYDENKASKEKLAELFTSVIFLGLTGTGKSSTAKSLSGVMNRFKAQAIGTKCETTKAESVISTWRDENVHKETKPAMFIDTPGMGDTEALDAIRIASIMSTLKSVGYVHSFVLVLNSQD